MQVSNFNLEQRSAVFRRLGVKPVINATWNASLYGGAMMSSETAQAMVEASRCLVNMDELNHKAGEIIAHATGAEAGMVCAGSASGLLLQAAACMSGTDSAKIARLPDITGMKHEIIIHKAHRFHYDQAYRTAGAKLVEIGTPKLTKPWMLEEAINANTAAIAYIAGSWFAHGEMMLFGSFPVLSLPQVIEIAHQRGIPVIVNAASTLPPAENLQHFIKLGADMVVYSGGKGLRGPQSTGLLCGKKSFIEAAFANSSPHCAIGRTAKVCKEEIMGLLSAIDQFMKRDHRADIKLWHEQSRFIVDALAGIPGIRAVVEHDAVNRPIPQCVVYFEQEWKGPPGTQIVTALREGDPPIHVLQGGYASEISINPFNFMDGEVELVANRLKEAFSR